MHAYDINTKIQEKYITTTYIQPQQKRIYMEYHLSIWLACHQPRDNWLLSTTRAHSTICSARHLPKTKMSQSRHRQFSLMSKILVVQGVNVCHVSGDSMWYVTIPIYLFLKWWNVPVLSLGYYTCIVYQLSCFCPWHESGVRHLNTTPSTRHVLTCA